MVQLAQRKLPAVAIGRQVNVLGRGRAIDRRLAGLCSRGLRSSKHTLNEGLGSSEKRLKKWRAAGQTSGQVCGLRTGTAAKERWHGCQS